MDTEEDAAVAFMPAGFSKASVQCKLLETIFEDPKHGADGKERYTSVRKYKRFIDFSAGPTASKKWKRSQKARKLAVYRQSPSFQHRVFECTQDVFTRPTQRKTRMRIPASTYQNGADHTLITRDTEPAFYSSITNGVCAAVDHLHPVSKTGFSTQEGRSNSCFKPGLGSGLPDTFIVSSGGLLVEEAATVELPLECVSNNSASIDVEVRSSIEDLLTAVVSSSNSCSLGHPCVRAGNVEHSELCDGKAGDLSRVSDRVSRVQPMAEPVKAQSNVEIHVPAKKAVRKRAAVWTPRHTVDKSVEGTVSELIAIIEATDTLCESVVENCGLSNCNVGSGIVSQLLHSFVERVPENVP